MLGILFIGALVFVLHFYDGQEAPKFGSAFGASLTLNTVTAILSTAAKAALLYPVAECVGQLKWIWFSQDYRQLQDMSMFENASRGIRGGLELLWKTRLGTFAVLGSLLMIYELAMDPMSQQLVSYASVPIPSPTNATVSTLTTWADILQGDQGGMIISGTGLFLLTSRFDYQTKVM